MNIQNIHNQQNYTPNFKANLVNNYPLKGLLVSAIDNPKYKEPLKKRDFKIKRYISKYCDRIYQKTNCQWQ